MVIACGCQCCAYVKNAITCMQNYLVIIIIIYPYSKRRVAADIYGAAASRRARGLWNWMLMNFCMCISQVCWSCQPTNRPAVGVLKKKPVSDFTFSMYNMCVCTIIREAHSWARGVWISAQWPSADAASFNTAPIYIFMPHAWKPGCNNRAREYA